MNILWPLSLLSLSFVPFQLNSPPRIQEQPALDVSISKVLPFQVYGENMIVVPGAIGTLQHLRFLIDTGTPKTLVDQGIATQLGLSVRPTRLFHFGTSVPAGRAVIPGIRYGPISVTDLEVGIADLSFTRTFGAQLDAIIGVDLLRLSSFSLDFRAKTISFATPKPDAKTLYMDYVQGYLVTNANMNGRPLRLVLDTGMYCLVLLPTATPPERLLMTRNRRILGRNAHGELIFADAFRLVSMRVGRSQLRGVGFVLEDRVVGQDSNFDGYLGTGILNAERLDFNFRDKTFGWQ